MLDKLYNLFQGYLRIKITGCRVEVLVNRLMREGIELWDIVRLENACYVNIKAKDFKEIKENIERIGCEIEVYDKKGGAFWIKRLLNRRALIIGIIFLIIGVYVLSQFVLFIEIKGTDEINPREIKQLLTEVKVKRGVLKSSIPLKELEEMLIQRKSQVGWAHLYFKGAKLVVEVKEKEVVDTEIKLCDVVAKKSGIITEIIVFKGTPKVEEGMTVSKGEVLISRYVKEKMEENDEREDEEEEIKWQRKEVKADGIVKARVWYEGYGEAKLVNYYQQPTGNYQASLILKYNNKEMVLKGPTKPPYSNFKVKEEVKSLPQWRNYSLPVELITRRYIQVQEFKEKRTFKEAKRIAREKAIDNILQRLSKEAIILNSKLKLIKIDNEKKLMRAKVLVEVKEDIAIRRE